MLSFIKREAVFCAAFFCAVISAFFVPPSKDYIAYIDWSTLCILFALMAVIQGFSGCGVFSAAGRALCGRLHTVRGLCSALVWLCFFTSMLVTNDVALITFVPFALLLLKDAASPGTIVLTVVLQTVAANTGSMLTPLGNPQNLFLFSQGRLTLAGFLLTMLPYTAASFAVILCALFFIPGKPLDSCEPVLPMPHLKDADGGNKVLYKTFIVRTVSCSMLFLLCVLSVLHIVPKSVTAAVVLCVMLLLDREALGKVDYMLLLTFAAFFIFTGNIGNIPAVKDALGNFVGGNEFLSAVIVSQVASNVPATLLLYPFSEDTRSLLLGVNVGGLGTLVASLASLISFKLYSSSAIEKKKSPLFYLGIFEALNVICLSALILLHLILG